MGTTDTLRTIADRQHGFVTSHQIRRLRLAGEEVDTAALTRIKRGIYSIDPGPVGWLRQVAAACLSSTNRIVASHRTAAQLHGLLHTDEIEVSVRHPAGVRATLASVHRVRDLDGIDVQAVDGIPTTTVGRTLCDLGAVVSPATVARLVDHAIATGRVARPELWRTRIRLGESGRNGVGALHLALSALPLEAEVAESGPEIALYRLVSGLDLPRPVLQYPLTIGATTYYPDLAFPDSRIALEYDGGIAHDSPAQQTRDRRRDTAFAGAGWITLRYRWADITALDRRLRIDTDIRTAMARQAA